MYIEKYNTLFIHIPRTGGTSVERLFGFEGGFETYDESKGMKQDHSTVSQVKPHLANQWDDLFKFSIVRNPWAKMVSMYLYRLNSPFYLKNNFEWENLHRARYGQNPSYEEWLETLPWTAGLPVRTLGCYNQLDYLMIDGKMQMDFVAKFENLKKDWPKIQKRMKCKLKLPHINKSKKSYDYRDFYNDKTKKIVENRFEKDIEYFGYRYEK